LVIAADDRVAEVEIFNRGLEFAAVVFGDPAPVDDRQLVGPPNRPIGIEQSVAQGIEGGPATKDQVVTVFDLGEEDAVLASSFSMLCFRKEGREVGEPLLPAGNDVVREQGV